MIYGIYEPLFWSNSSYKYWMSPYKKHGEQMCILVAIEGCNRMKHKFVSASK